MFGFTEGQAEPAGVAGWSPPVNFGGSQKSPVDSKTKGKKNLHVRSQNIEILMLIREKKLPTTAMTIKFVQNTFMPN